METTMCGRIDDIIAFHTKYYGSTLYEAIMAVADVTDLDNAELDELEQDFCFGPRERVTINFTLDEGNV